MMGIYTAEGRRFPSKKALKASVGSGVIFEETSLFGNEFKGEGEYTIVGPHPYDRRWFATVKVNAARTLLGVK